MPSGFFGATRHYPFFSLHQRSSTTIGKTFTYRPCFNLRFVLIFPLSHIVLPIRTHIQVCFSNPMEVLYEDNHIIIVNKAAGEIVQGDKTGDSTLADAVKAYIKEKYAKPGEVFLGIVHRLDRPVSGIVVYARTSKALSRLNEMFRLGKVHKTYHAITPNIPLAQSGQPQLSIGSPTNLVHFLTRNERQNKAYAHLHEMPGSKRASLDATILKVGDNTQLLEVNLHTGRHHQIRCQLATIGYPIRGDLKYGAPRSNPDGSICLHARHIEFLHPVSKKLISVTAPYPQQLNVWRAFE